MRFVRLVLAVVALAILPGAPVSAQCLTHTLSSAVADHPSQSQSVSLNGEFLVLGAPSDMSATGAAVPFHADTTGWMPAPVIRAPDGESGDHFGISVAVTATHLFVGASAWDLEQPATSDCGAVYVYRREAGQWTFSERLLAPTPQNTEFFGRSLDASSRRLAVGAPGGQGGNHVGSVYLFHLTNSGNWVHEATLTPSDGAIDDRFGFAVAFGDETLLVGAYAHANSGAVYVFGDRGTANWEFEGKLIPNDLGTGDAFGISVAADGNQACIGASENDNERGQDAGAAYVFVRRGSGNWDQVAKLLPAAASSGSAAHSIGFEADRAILRADVNSVTTVYWFVRRGNAWHEQWPFPIANNGVAISTAAVHGGKTAVRTAMYPGSTSTGFASTAYVLDLGACGCYADCNGDGVLNIADFGCFQSRFALGCP